MRVEAPVDRVSPGVAVAQLQGHVGVTGAPEVSRPQASGLHHPHSQEADVLGLGECFVQALDKEVRGWDTHYGHLHSDGGVPPLLVSSPGLSP